MSKMLWFFIAISLEVIVGCALTRSPQQANVPIESQTILTAQVSMQSNNYQEKKIITHSISKNDMVIDIDGFFGVPRIKEALDLIRREDTSNTVFTYSKQLLSHDDFEKQKDKYFLRNCLGGAIGILVDPNENIVLVNRLQLYSGWALPGGMVEQGEGFREAFTREIREEIGVSAMDPKLILVEEKEFISPSNLKFKFLLAVYYAKIKEKTLPASTANAQKENITASLIPMSKLPENMILKDREKINFYLNSINYSTLGDTN